MKNKKISDFTALRIRKSTWQTIQLAYVREQAKKGTRLKMQDFTDEVVKKGLEALGYSPI